MTGVVDTIPTTNVTVPAFLRSYSNGKLPADIMRCPDLDRSSTAQVWKMFAPVSWAMTAMQIAAKADGIRIPVGNPTALGNDNILDTTGRYRSYERQEALFKERYTTTVLPNRPRKWWEGQWWYQKPGVAMAATPGTSNHGLGLADDVAEDPDQFDGTAAVAIDQRTLAWMRDNATDFGFGLETHKEAWHWHWIGKDALPQRAADVLRNAGLTIPDLSQYGFFVPPVPTPDPPPEDEVTDADIAKIVGQVTEAVAAEVNDPAYLDAIAQRVVTVLVTERKVTEPTTKTPVTYTQLWQNTRTAASRADFQTRPPTT